MDGEVVQVIIRLLSMAAFLFLGVLFAALCTKNTLAEGLIQLRFLYTFRYMVLDGW